MSTTDRIDFAGDVRIEELTIITSKGVAQDISPQVIGIEIFEDIFSPFITGNLVIKDAQELSNLLPLIGEEILRIKFQTPSLEKIHGYDGEFMVVKMEDRFHSAERELIYVLHFISKEGVVDLNKKISKGFNGKVSDIALSILQDKTILNTKKPCNVEETTNTTRYVSNFWSPVKNLRYLCETAINGSGAPSYTFFENKYGLNFVSLESLYHTTPLIQAFIWDNYTADVTSTGGSRRNIEQDYKRIIEMRTPQTYNYIDRLTSGMFGSELITYDILSKQYVHVAHTPSFDNFKHLNKYPLYSTDHVSAPRSVITYIPKYYNNFDNYDDVTNAAMVQKRKQLMAEAEAFKIEIDVFGRSDYSAGQRVYIEIPLSTQISNEDTNPIDKLHSGHYLIAAIRHTVSREKHQCTMELIKDSYMVDVNAK